MTHLEPVHEPTIIAVTLDEQSLGQRSEEARHECETAISDLLDDNVFYPCGVSGDALFDGPYTVHVNVQDNRLHMHINHSRDKEYKAEVMVPVTPFRSIIKDYFLICDSYQKALQGANHRQVEAIDMGRRGMHNEGSELLSELLDGRAYIDFTTARRLFTLLCALHMR